MSKLLEIVSRFGPLVAAILVGVSGLLAAYAPNATPFVNGFLTFFGFFGVTPDAAVAESIGDVIAAGFLVYGGLRKVINLVREKYGSAPVA